MVEIVQKHKFVGSEQVFGHAAAFVFNSLNKIGDLMFNLRENFPLDNFGEVATPLKLWVKIYQIVVV